MNTHDPEASSEISERKKDNFLNTFSLRFKSFWKSEIHECNMEQCHLSEESMLCLYKRIVYVIFISFLIQLESLLWFSKNNFVKNERIQIIISLFCPETFKFIQNPSKWMYCLCFRACAPRGFPSPAWSLCPVLGFLPGARNTVWCLSLCTSAPGSMLRGL